MLTLLVCHAIPARVLLTHPFPSFLLAQKNNPTQSFLRPIWNLAHGIQQTQEPPTIIFCDFNDEVRVQSKRQQRTLTYTRKKNKPTGLKTFPSNGQVTLHVQVQHVTEPLTVNIFHLNAASVYKELMFAFGTDLDLDGVVPHESLKFGSLLGKRKTEPLTSRHFPKQHIG